MASLPRPILRTDVNYVVRHYGTYNVYRFVADDGSKYHFFEIGKFIGDDFKLHSPPKTKMGHRHSWTVRKIRELRLDQPFNPGSSEDEDFYERIIGEIGIPKQMRDEIPEWAKPSLDASRTVVEALWKKWGAAIITRDATYSEAVKEGIALSGLSAPSVRRLIAVFFFYGHHDNACLDHYWLKGGPGISRRDAVYADGTHIDVGRPTNAQRLNPKTKAKKRRFTKRRYDHYTKFIKKEGNSNETLTELNNRYRANIFAYTSKTKLKEGQKALKMRVHDRHIPPNTALSKVGGPLLKLVRLQRELKDRWAPGKRLLSGGNAQILVDGEHSAWDLDATMPKNYLVLDDKYQTKINSLVQPNIFFAVCRQSSAIVGYYVTFGFENGRSYLSLMWSCYTDKTDDLKRWGVPDLLGMVHGVTSAVVMDRGPGRHEAVQKVFTEKARIKVIFSEPGRGENKGHVEIRHRLAQRNMRHLEGSLQPVESKFENRERAKRVRKGYGITLSEFMKHLLEFISAHNLKVNKNIVVTKEMDEDRIPQIPKDVFEYYQRKRFGHQAMRMPEDLVYKLFCISHDKTTNDGYVTLERRRYYSIHLEEAAITHYRLFKESMAIKVLEAPAQPLTLYWERESDGALVRLDADKKTVEQYGDTYRWEHDAKTLRVDARNQERVAKDKAKETKTYNANVDRGLISADAQKEIAQSAKRAPRFSGQPEKRRAARRGYTEAVNDEDVARVLNKIQGDKFPDLHPEKMAEGGDEDYSGVDDNQDLGAF